MYQVQTGPPYRHYTDREIDTANDTDLPDLLNSLGYHVKRVGRYYTTREMDSLRIKGRRTWYRYSESRGGDAVEFLRHFHGMPFADAVQFLLAFNSCPMDSSNPPPICRSRPPSQRERPAFVLPPPNSDNERVRAYLRGRGIAPDIISHFIEAGLLYEDTPYHNCVFVGRDSAGKPVFAAKRGTWGDFKGDAAGSDKSIAFRLPCNPALNSVHVFESPIDLMSWLTIYGRTNAVALCGLYDGPLETYLRENPHIRLTVFCLDADEHGQETAGKLTAKYQARGYETEKHLPPLGKDWNEYLQKYHHQPDGLA